MHTSPLTLHPNSLVRLQILVLIIQSCPPFYVLKYIFNRSKEISGYFIRYKELAMCNICI